MLPGLLLRQGEIRWAMVVDKKHILAVATGLSNVMRIIRNRDWSGPCRRSSRLPAMAH